MTRSRHARRLGLAVALPASFALAACSSSTAGSGTTSPSTSSSSSSSTSSSSSPNSSPGSGTAVVKTRFATELSDAVSSTRSARFSLSGGAAGQSISGSGSETFRNGKASAVQLTETIPGASAIEYLMVHGQSYLALPPALRKGGKKYLLISAHSSNPAARAAAQAMAATGSSTPSLASVRSFVTAAKSVTDLGSATVRGAQATHYRIVVDFAKLPLAKTVKAAARQAGLGDIPVDLYTDSRHRPVRVVEAFTLKGQQISFTFDLFDFDAPVHISAPPAGQVQH